MSEEFYLSKMDYLKITELEEKVLCYLAYLSYEEMKLQFENILMEEWTTENRKILDVLHQYSLQDHDSIEGTARDWLLTRYKNSNHLINILENFIPSIMGKKYVQELAYNQEELKYKRALRELVNKPLKEIKPALFKLTQTPVSAFKPKSIMQTAKQRVYERKLESDAPSTGFKELDVFIRGFIPGHTYTLSGETNAGKSTVALNFAHNLSQQQKTTLYFALEPENNIVDYLASIRLKKRFAELTDEDILHDDPNIHVFGKDQIRAIEDLIKALHSLPRYDFVVIDHIGYFTGNTTNITGKQSDVMKDLAGISKERHCAVMLIQHLNKSKSDKLSPENNITGSAAFKQDATEVLLIERDRDEDEFGRIRDLNTGNILIRKTKTGGGNGYVPITYVEGTALILSGIGHGDKDLDDVLGLL